MFGVTKYNSDFHETTITLDSNYNELFSSSELGQHTNSTPVSNYQTDSSVAYKNDDGTTSLYVYSAPVNFLRNSQYVMIDTRIKNIQDDAFKQNGFVYTVSNNDIIPYYPEKLSASSGVRLSKDFYYDFGLNTSKAIPAKYTEKSNFIGDQKKMITYSNAAGNGIDVNFYPSSLGTNCEISFSKKPKTNAVSFWLRLSDPNLAISKEPGGYLVIYTTGAATRVDGAPEKNIVAVIQPPLLKDANNTIFYDNSVDCSKVSDGNYSIDFTFDDKGLSKNSTAYISWEMRVEKEPDTALYSGKPSLQYAYLINRTIIGNSTDYGIGEQLIRFRFCNPFNLKSANIVQANFYMYDVSRLDKNHPKQTYQLNSVLDDWCSVLGNWNKHYKIGEQTSECNDDGEILSFDITNEVKKWCDDTTGQMEHNGVLLKASDENTANYDVILSNDNALYRNRTEVILK